MRTPPDPHATLTPTAERIHSVAAELFYTRGIRAVGVDLIADEAQTTKKTLYDRFGSKDGLVAFYLERRYLRWQQFVLAHIDTVSPDAGADRVLAVFDALGLWMRANTRGCGFVNAFAEIAGTDHPGLGVIRTEKHWARTLYIELVRDAGIPDADTVGNRLFLLHEGAVVVGTAGGFEPAVSVARDFAAEILAQQGRVADEFGRPVVSTALSRRG